METKTCSVCGESKPATTEYFTTNGKRGLHTQCRVCKAAKAKKNYDANKDNPEWVERQRKAAAKHRDSGKARARRDRYKQEFVDMKGGKCQRCGYDKCLDALEFHHKDPSVKETMLNKNTLANTGRREELLAELEKCELLCSNCHREVHCLL